MNIVLTGFMATGKTEISKAIAAMSDYTMIDTDDMIVKSAGMSINDIFAEYGEKYFREIEHKCVCEAAAMDNMIIATGGGVVLNKANMKELRKNGKIVNLAPDFSVIEKRLYKAASTRPLLTIAKSALSRWVWVYFSIKRVDFVPSVRLWIFKPSRASKA